MRDNYNTTVDGERVKLVPYRPEHVGVYHKWMSDPILQEATASEPLSFEEEKKMQESWVEDPKKCTFILLDKSLQDTPGTGIHGGAMAGDVNLFWNDPNDPNYAEIEVMVAEERSRRKGIAHEALRLFIAFSVKFFGVRRFGAKIGEGNGPSISLFTKLGFLRVGNSQIFKEVHLEFSVTGADKGQIEQLGSQLLLGTYDKP